LKNNFLCVVALILFLWKYDKIYKVFFNCVFAVSSGRFVCDFKMYIQFLVLIVLFLFYIFCWTNLKNFGWSLLFFNRILMLYRNFSLGMFFYCCFLYVGNLLFIKYNQSFLVLYLWCSYKCHHKWIHFFYYLFLHN